MNLSDVMDQLEIERKRVQSELGRLDAAVDALRAFNTNGSNGIVSSPKKRTMSAAGRRAISLAQKARWARAGQVTPKPKRALSASARRRIAAAQRARWAAWKAKRSRAA